MGASLTARDLYKSFGGAVAVDGIDLDVPSGAFVSLLGPSGCGKTTTLRMIAGLEHVDRGQIAIDGKEVTHLSPQKRNLGMVFQHYALFPNLTAAENIAFGLRVRRMPSAQREERVRELLETVQLSNAAQKYPHELSGGMQQRVALARALAIAPPLLLLDEPLSALDAAIRESLRTELRQLQRRLDLTMIYVTHDQSEAMALSDQIVVMDKGAISQVGSPRELYDEPATRFASLFVGVSNNRETTVIETAGAPAIQWGPAALPISRDTHIPVGQRVTASWRPEAALLVQPESHGVGYLRGTLEMITFLGPITRLYVALENDDNQVMVDLSSEDAYRLRAGQTVTLRVPAKSVRVFA